MTTTLPMPAHAQAALFAEVAVNSSFPHRQTFTYSVPDALPLRPGHAVYVPFGRQMLQGVVLDVTTNPAFTEPEKIRPVRSIIGADVLIDEDRLAVARWIAAYYIAPLFDSVALFLPPGFERRPLTLLQPLVEREEVAGLPDLTERQRQVLEALFAEGARDLEGLRARLKHISVDAALAQLERRGLLAREYTLARPRIGPKSVRVASLTMPADEARLRIAEAVPRKRSRRGAVIERLLVKRQISTEEAQRLAGSRANLDRLFRAGSIRFDREGHNVTLGIAPAEAAEEIRRMTQTKRAAQAQIAVRVLSEHEARTLPELRAAGVETATA